MTQAVDPTILQHLSDRAVMSKDQFLALPDELRLRSFTIARQTDANVLQDTLDALRDTISKGGTLWDFRENFPNIAAPYTEAGRDWHLNLVFQQNVRQARAVGAYQARQKVKRAFPYVEYITGPNPRPAHAALNGKIFGIDDLFLATHTPPWDFNCNCDLIPRTAAQVGKAAEEDTALPPDEQRVVPESPALQGMLQHNQLPDPERGAISPVNVATPTERGGEYSFRPDRLNQPVDLTGYDPEIKAALVKQLEELGYRLRADGVTADPGPFPTPSPKSPPPPPPPPSDSASASRNPRVGRPSASKTGRLTLSAAQDAGRRPGCPVGRVSRPAPQIARVTPPQPRFSRQEAA